jgi:malate dehydrogenase (oxaloacetate-decarboxylating)
MGGEPSSLPEIMKKADIVVATTGVRGLIDPAAVRPGQIILALSNPDPEIEPGVALARGAAVAADGKSINNLLGFPGLFKGALEVRAKRFTDGMLLAAAATLAELARGEDLVPDPLDRLVHQAVAAAVSRSSQPGAS